MSFDELINKKMPEVEIFDRVVTILQKNFIAYKDVNVCLPLDLTISEINAIQEVRFYNIHNPVDVAAKRQFLFGTQYFSVFLITKFYDGFYRMTLFGHFITKSGDIYPNEIKRIDSFTSDSSRTLFKNIPYEIVAGAFGEIKSAVNDLKKSS